VYRTIAALVGSCHPEPTAAVTVMITALAVTAGHRPGMVVLIGAAVLTGQLTIGWLNDAVDADRDRATGRTDKPVAAGVVSIGTVRVAVVIATVVTIALSLVIGLVAGAVQLVAVASGWSYDLGLKSTPFSVAPYLVAFGALPAFVVLALPAVPPWWLIAAGALVGAGAHFANVLPDLAADAATGVRGLPHRLGARGSQIAAAALLLAATVVIAVFAPVPLVVAVVLPVLAAAVLAAGFVAGRAPGSRAPFRSVLVAAAIAVALLLTAGSALTT
jgi:4-hydroxybenzoate polyprenyltransferase